MQRKRDRVNGEKKKNVGCFDAENVALDNFNKTIKKKKKKCQDVEKISGTVKVMRRRRKRTMKNMASTHNMLNTRSCGVCTSFALSLSLFCTIRLSLSLPFCIYIYIFRYFLRIHIYMMYTHL